MSSNNGFIRPGRAAATSDAAQESTLPQKKNHNYPDKEILQRAPFFIVLIPETEALADYANRSITYHVELGLIPIPRRETDGAIVWGRDRSELRRNLWNPRGQCLGAVCPKCESNRRIYGPHNKSVPFKERASIGRFFLAYMVTQNADGTFGYQDGVEPSIFEYKSRWNPAKTVSNGRGTDRKGAYDDPDWDNLMNEFFKLVDAGIDPVAPEAGVVFQVELQRVAVTNTDKDGVEKPVRDQNGNDLTKYVWRHTPTEARLALPAGWEAQVKEYYPLTELYLGLSKEEMGILVDSTDQIAEIMSDKRLSETPREQIRLVDKAYKRIRGIKQTDFHAILMSKELHGPTGRPQDTTPQGVHARDAAQSLAKSPAAQSPAPRPPVAEYSQASRQAQRPPQRATVQMAATPATVGDSRSTVQEAHSSQQAQAPGAKTPTPTPAVTAPTAASHAPTKAEPATPVPTPAAAATIATATPTDDSTRAMLEEVKRAWRERLEEKKKEAK